MAVKVLLVDDHEMFRQGLCSLLQEQSDMEVVAEAQDGATAVRLARELKPDIIIMDVDMPGMNGIDATRQIFQRDSGIKIIALSSYLKKAFIIEMLKAGASSYILKEQAFAKLVEAINTVMAGEIYLCSKATSVIVDDYARSRKAINGFSDMLLTEREIEVLKLLAEGKASKEIALIINMSVKTVDAARRRIMQKLKVNSLAELVKYAIREGLTSLDS